MSVGRSSVNGRNHLYYDHGGGIISTAKMMKAEERKIRVLVAKPGLE